MFVAICRMMLLLVSVVAGYVAFDSDAERNNLADSFMKQYPGIIGRLRDSDVNSIHSLFASDKRCKPVGVAIDRDISSFLDAIIHSSKAQAYHNALYHFDPSSVSRNFANSDDVEKIGYALAELKKADEHYASYASSWFYPIPSSIRSALIYPDGCKPTVSIHGPKDMLQIVDKYVKVRGMFQQLRRREHISTDYTWLLLPAGSVLLFILIISLILLCRTPQHQRNYESAGIINPGQFTDLRPL